jgi:dTDP-glucose 4,6-dehydratase
MKKILVTGGCGFIGSEFVRQGLKRNYEILVLDKLTYAGDLTRIPKGDVKFYRGDIADPEVVKRILKRERPDYVVNFAAETHVDRSIFNPSLFLETNVKGTNTLLAAIRTYEVERFLHISTDEVYGEIKKGRFTEESPFAPNSPYAVSKAAGDMLVKAYHRTYHLPVLIVRPSNTYGPFQYPEKLIPLTIYYALKNRRIPVYGRGENIREWFYVEDCAEGIFRVLEEGKIGEAYNITSGEEKKNIFVVKSILSLLGKPLSLIQFVRDRPGHDYRYALSTRKIRRELNWQAKTKFKDGLKRTVEWYLDNLEWMERKVRQEKEYFRFISRFYSPQGD